MLVVLRQGADLLFGHLYRDRRGAFAFVTTNSITQGQPVPALFAPIYRAGFDIKFAHRTFQWDSEAPGKAAVHCVVIGFDRATKPPARLFSYTDLRGAPEEQPVRAINRPALRSASSGLL